MAIAYIALMRPGPRIATTAIASSKLGSASMTSISRMITVSVSPRAYPATTPSTTPSVSDSATEMSPISSDSRVPWMSLDSMSRPRGSVPRMKSRLPSASQTGGTRVNWRYCSFGGCGEMTPAKAAGSNSITIRMSPAIAPRLCRETSQNSRSGAGGVAAELDASGAASLIASSVSGMANAGIDDPVEQIDDQIDADHERGDEQDAALHDGVVARLHAVHEPVAHARP